MDVGVDGGGLDRVDAPAGGERGEDVAKADAVWHIRLRVAVAEHEVPTSGAQDGPQAVHVRGTVGAVQDVEQLAVDHRAERLNVELGEPAGVGVQETRGESALGELALGDAQSRFSEVDPGHVETELGGQHRVLTGPAAHVQEPAAEGARAGERGEGGLGPPDVPRWPDSIRTWSGPGVGQRAAVREVGRVH